LPKNKTFKSLLAGSRNHRESQIDGVGFCSLSLELVDMFPIVSKYMGVDLLVCKMNQLSGP